MAQLEASMKEKKATMASQILVAKDSVRSTTEKISAHDSNHGMSFEREGIQSVEKIKTLLNDDANSEDVFNKLSTLIEKRTHDITQEAESHSSECVALQRRIEGYNLCIEKCHQ